jgi:hypothetical protein
MQHKKKKHRSITAIEEQDQIKNTVATSEELVAVRMSILIIE